VQLFIIIDVGLLLLVTKMHCRMQKIAY